MVIHVVVVLAVVEVVAAVDVDTVHSSKEGALFGAPTDLHSASMVR